MKAVLVLEDGTVFEGTSFGTTGKVFGEVVFNTCMSGYQEILTDPSYKGQMVVMTYPMIGNYGFNNEDNESYQPHVQGFIVKELCELPSNWRNQGTPNDYFINQGICGICDIDTRKLTQHIRNHGSMYGVISTIKEGYTQLVHEARDASQSEHDLVDLVTTKQPIYYEWNGKNGCNRQKVVVLDFGVKQNIVRSLLHKGCEVVTVPAHTKAEDILSFCPDGILLSNGPGDPMDVSYAVDTIQQLLGIKPILGICLGHQLLGHCLGGKTYKLKFGHHGGNHPVKDLLRNRVYITSQNHNYALHENFNPHVIITHMNLNDHTVEGFKHDTLPVLSVQYHPEAAPGPMDSNYIFDEFIELMKNYPSSTYPYRVPTSDII